MLPEIDKDQLTGAVTETTSSDSYIEGAVTTLKGEVYGLSGQVVDVRQAEVYTPHKMGSDPTELNTEKSLLRREHDQGIRKLTHRHSALGSRIVQRRQLKKSA
jgi:hypothetical protein